MIENRPKVRWYKWHCPDCGAIIPANETHDIIVCVERQKKRQQSYEKMDVMMGKRKEVEEVVPNG